MDQNESTLFKLEVEEVSSRFLAETAKWGKFLSIVGFIITGFIVIAALFAGTMFASIPGWSNNAMMAGGVSIFITLLYLAIALLYFFPCLYMYRFSVRMKRALYENNQDVLNSSFSSLKSCFKFMGIMTIIFLSLYALAFIFGMFASLMK